MFFDRKCGRRQKFPQLTSVEVVFRVEAGVLHDSQDFQYSGHRDSQSSIHRTDAYSIKFHGKTQPIRWPGCVAGDANAERNFPSAYRAPPPYLDWPATLPGWRFLTALWNPVEETLKRYTSRQNHGCNAGFLNLWATEESSMDHGLTLKLSAFLNLDVLMENVGSSSATSVVISSLVTTACVRNYCNMEISHKAYHILHNMQLLKAFWDRQATFVAMKTKCRIWLKCERWLDLCIIMYWVSNIFSF